MAAIIVNLVFIFLGLLALVSALLNWEWFYGVSSTGLVTKVIGRIGTRIFYGIVGFSFIFMGLSLLSDSV